MIGNTIPRPYVVRIRHWPDGKDAKFIDHDVEVVAYDLMEAMMMASMQFDHDNGNPSEHGGKVKAIFVRPAGAEVRDALAAMFTERAKR